MTRARTCAPGKSSLRLPASKAAAILVAVTLVCCAPAFALDPALDVSQYAHTAWKVRDGFTKGVIYSLAQGPDGYLWLGTEFGVVRFDGVRAVPWQFPAGQQLPSNFIFSLLFARDGTLWIGTNSGLASWKDGRLAVYPEMADLQVARLFQDREGTVWAGSVRSPRGAKLCSIHNAHIDCHDREGRLGNVISALYQDTSGNLWVGVVGGFWRWKPGPPKFFPAPSDMSGIRGFAEDDQQALLIGAKGGLRRLVNGRQEAYPLPYLGMTDSVFRMFRDRDGGLWIATLSHGVVHVHHGRVDTFTSSDGLSGDAVWNVVEDREGNVWTVGTGGIDRFREYSIATLSKKQGVSNPLVFSVVAGSDGNVRFATPDGLNIWDHGRISVFRPSNGAWSPEGPLYGTAPKHLFEDNSGRIWVSTAGEFGYLDGGRFVKVSGYPGGYLEGIAEGSTGHLWVASQESGLAEVFEGRVIRQVSWAELGFHQKGISLASDPKTGGLWFGFDQGGIAYVVENKVQAFWTVADGLGRGAVRQLRFDSRGTLWAATEGGLSRVRNGHISTLNSRNGLPCDTVYWTMEDDDHALWLSMSCGVVQIGRDKLNEWVADPNRTIDVRVLSASDGVWPHSWAGEYWSSVTKARDGKIWFVNSVGISVLDPHHIPVNRVPPPVHIEQLFADNKRYNPKAGLRLPPRIHYLAIDYTALSLAAPEAVRFRYRLEGVDPRWREVIDERKVQYSNLSPGHYRFRVIAANNSGLWNEQGDTLEFDVLPAWYQTLWFRAACVLASFMLLWALYRYRVHQLQEQEAKFREVVETMPAMAFVVEPGGNRTFVNRGWLKYTGLNPEQASGSGWERAVHPDDLKRVVDRWRAAQTTGQPLEYEVRVRRGSDGTFRWFQTRAEPLRDKRDKIVKWYAVATDIEDRKRAEQLQSDLAHVNRISTLGELTASISHELKQPIAAAVLNASTALLWLKHDPPNVNEASEVTNEIINSGKLAGEIIDRLRSLYKKALPKQEPLDLNKVIGKMIEMLRAEAARHRVSVHADLAGDLPTISGDSVQIQQVVMNLMLNGIEAMSDAGGILTIKSEAREDGKIQISVKDTGPGLPPDETDRIFDAFFTTKPQGSGMGLAICKSIIESHGGRIWASGSGGTGATFSFTLPAAAVGSEDTSAADQAVIS